MSFASQIRSKTVVRGCNDHFALNLRELSDIPIDKYLQKTVIISYWRQFPDIFEGEISCISSKMQIRLQHITCLYVNENTLPNTIHHSYWFHYKNIKTIHYNNQDITKEILDIMKYRMIQSFLFYCSETETLNLDKSDESMQIQWLRNENISKILNEFSKDPSDMELYNECHISEILKLYTSMKQTIESPSLQNKMYQFLFDLNRINKHLLLKPILRNKQRIACCIDKYEMEEMLCQYKVIIVAFVNQLVFSKTFCVINQLQRKDNESDELQLSWSSYIDWDTNEIDKTLKNWKLYKPNAKCVQLYDTKAWSNSPTTLTIRRNTRRRNTRRRRIRIRKPRLSGFAPAKNDGLDNKWKSQGYRHHNNPLEHGKKLKKMKKLKKKRSRINVNKDTKLRTNGIFG